MRGWGVGGILTPRRKPAPRFRAILKQQTDYTHTRRVLSTSVGYAGITSETVRNSIARPNERGFDISSFVVGASAHGIATLGGRHPLTGV